MIDSTVTAVAPPVSLEPSPELSGGDEHATTAATVENERHDKYETRRMVGTSLSMDRTVASLRA